jgi:hypothetical protein
MTREQLNAIVLWMDNYDVDLQAIQVLLPVLGWNRNGKDWSDLTQAYYAFKAWRSAQ